ncbi:hypothetical protein CM1200mP19_2500 [bacterium]|nr:MAG: hypothetical protein CM1200mP19_2500 [bacterium]
MDWSQATTFGDLLVRSAEKHGSKEAIVVQDDRRSFEGLLWGPPSRLDAPFSGSA